MGLLLTASQKKFGQMQERMYGSHEWQSKLLVTRLEHTLYVHSSWIRNYVYDDLTATMYMTTWTGKTYEWPNIPPDIASKIKRGLATCRTTDPTGQGRWFAGKHPSLGAAFWEYLKPLSGRMALLSQILKAFILLLEQVEQKHGV